MQPATRTQPAQPTKPVLRRPFRAVAAISRLTAKIVNGVIDNSANAVKSLFNNKLVHTTGRYIHGFQQGVQGKVAPYTEKAKPYVQPVVPYINKARPYVPPAIIATILFSAPPVMLFLGFIAFITAPIWLTVGFFTAFIWIPIAIFMFLTTTFLAFIILVRYFSHPAGQTRLRRVWKTISTTRLGQKIFYVTPSPAYPQQGYK